MKPSSDNGQGGRGSEFEPFDPRAKAHPIDSERLASALESANLPTILMVLTHLTGDERWLESPFQPSRPRRLNTNDSGGFSDEIASEVRAAAAAAIAAWANGAAPVLPEPGPEMLQRMLSVSMGEDVPDEYQQLAREEMRLSEAAASTDEMGATDLSVIIIGAGVSGLLAGSRLKALGIPFQILERNSDIGGVWLTNRYPGAGVDTPSYLYSFADLPRNWSKHFARRDEVMDYLGAMADRFGLREHVVLGVRVEQMEYDEDSQRWSVTATDADGNLVAYDANAVVSAVGLFNKPKEPRLEGLSDFAGDLAHTARWPTELTLTGKRVAVVGAGASAMQVVPAIAEDVESLAVFQRSAQWVSPADGYFDSVPDDSHWLMSNVPYYHAWYRMRLAWMFNDRIHASLRVDPEWPNGSRSLNAVNDAHRKIFTRYIEEQLDGRPDLIDKSVPQYPPFGKRMLLDNGWYAALKRPNVELVTEPVDHVTMSGIVTADGLVRDFDVIILATGFDTFNYLRDIEIVGRNGRRLVDEWVDDDARAYLGMTVPGFPNLFIMYGPNTNSGGGSYIFIAECQIRHITGLLTTMIREGVGALECDGDAAARWIEEVDEAHESMVWSHPGMTTYYRNPHGRVVVVMPYRVVEYWSMTHDADPSAYVLEPAIATSAAKGTS